jgi:hypothetical protein
MTDNTTISIPKQVRDDLEELKDHDNQPYWEVVVQLIDLHRGDVMDGHNSGVDEAKIARQVIDEMNGIEWHVDTTQVAREVTDDLTTQLPPKIAEELQQ